MMQFWHHLLSCETPTLLMPLEGVARRLDHAGGLLWRLQRVDGRRVDAFVGGLLCSRLHCVTAPTVSNVSAPLLRVRVSECALVRVWVWVCACLPTRVGACVCVSRYRAIDILEGIDFAARMEKGLVTFKVMYRIDSLPCRCTCAQYAPGPQGTAPTFHHAALDGCTIFRCPRSLMHAPQRPLSSDVLMAHAQVDHIIDKLAPTTMICALAGLISLGLVLLGSVSWFAP